MNFLEGLWYSDNILDVFKELRSSERGLSSEEAKKRLNQYGKNELPKGKVDSLATIFLRQFKSPLIYILFVAGFAILAINEITDAIIVFSVLFFNAIIGTIQEGRSQNTLLALKKFTETSATVLRDNNEIIIPGTEIVPGDVLVIRSGEKIPADARVIHSNSLKIDEATLTGESEPVLKTDDAINAKNLSVANQKNMIFKGTLVSSGDGIAIATSTGSDTEIGKIAQKISNIDTEIPLKKDIKYLSRIIIAVTVAIIAIIIVISMFSGEPIKEMFLTAVALSISIIPEGLPVVMTLILATGVKRMSKQNALIKKLQAVEALGHTQVIAVDKTGTLTKNEMVVQKIYTNGRFFDIRGNGYETKGDIVLNGKIINPTDYEELVLSAKIGALSSDAHVSYIKKNDTWKVSGDPTEAAMVVFSEKIGFTKQILEQKYCKIFEAPFNYQKKYHATIHLSDKKRFLSIAGAPEKIIDLCGYIWEGGKNNTLTRAKRENLESIFSSMASKGLRIVAFAMNANYKHKKIIDSSPLTFLGFFGIKDALRPEVTEAVKKVLSANIRVVMITGDHKLTAEAIAKEAGIYYKGSIILTGKDVDALNKEMLAEKLGSVSVFARVTPEQKLKIIESYRLRGEVVAMTGDGVNDAPSLVAADLGVAMGKIGTEVAKEAADIILLDDNFGTIVSAAEEGRNIYKSIKKIILYLFSTNLGEALTIIGALLLGLQLPILPAQIIWLNFVTDGFLDVSLAMEPKEKNLLRKKFAKPKKYLVDKLMAQRMFLMSIIMMTGTIFMFYKYVRVDSAKAWTISLTMLAVFQWLNAWNCRSEEKSIFQTNPFSNKFLIGSTVIVILLQFFALYTPFLQKVLNTTPLLLSDWLLIILIGFSIVVAEELRKFFYRKNHSFGI